MNTLGKSCRNCGGELYSKRIPVIGELKTLLPLGFFSIPEFILKVCGTCGLTEWFVAAEQLEKVKEKFTKE